MGIVLTDHDTFFIIRFCKIFKGFKKGKGRQRFHQRPESGEG